MNLSLTKTKIIYFIDFYISFICVMFKCVKKQTRTI
jgi:hypothetical protein